jgi:hypothetical protein
MVRRCTDPKFGSYQYYGACGISVDPAWLGPEGFIRFLEHVGISPSPKHTLDRYPDRNGNYTPGNVRWATPKEQARNRKSNVLLTAFGKTMAISAWAEEMHINKTTIQMRLARGWTHERAIGEPLKHGRHK